MLAIRKNVNLSAATRSMNLLSPARLWPMAKRTGEQVKEFVETEKAMFGSMAKPRKAPKVRRPKAHARRTVRVHPAHA